MGDEKENLDRERNIRQQARLRLRGALRDVYAEYGGGEAYLRREREIFNHDMERREAQIEEATSRLTDKEISKHES